MSELFARADFRGTKPAASAFPRCGQCGLHAKCQSPKLGVWGRGARSILVVGPPPTASVDVAGHWLAGAQGRWLRSELEYLKVDVEADLWFTGALICAPGDSRPPTAIEDCRPNLLNTIRRLDPKVIVLVGMDAVSALIPHLWKSDVDPITRWTGRAIPAHKPNAWICPLNDLDYMVRDKPDPLARSQFRQALAHAVKLTARPWPAGPPDYGSRVEVITSPTTAASRLRTYQEGRLAFDFETDRLRPDHADASIVCCAVCFEGKETIAFPWHGPVIPEMKRIVTSSRLSKIGYNISFEIRWILAKLGVESGPWEWDGMLAAHALDPRRGRSGGDGSERGSGTTGLKFQAFVRLGAGDYSGTIEEYLRPVERNGERAGTNDPNRTRQAPLDKLLFYCGLDALLEWEVAMHQMAEMGGA